MKYICDWVRTHKYCLVMLYCLFYIPAFFTLERVSVPIFEAQCALDRAIPFIPVFVFPYFTWHLLFPGLLIYFMFKSRNDFMHLSINMFTGMTIALLIYAVLPSSIDLRPAVLGNSISEKICAVLYAMDTPTNVLPSIHVSSTVSIILAVRVSESLKNRRAVKTVIYIVSALIILSTMFIKQHSIYDVVSGAALSIVLWYIIPDRLYLKSSSKGVGLKEL